jgi:hypothetical protein
MAGYSGTPLAEKLGIVAGKRGYVVGAPASPGAVFDELVLLDELRAAVDYAHVFSTSRAELETIAPGIVRALDDRGLFWISWPKKAAKTPSTVDESVVRGVGLSTGMVDVKVCAVDETWSALKFVRRLRDR